MTLVAALKAVNLVASESQFLHVFYSALMPVPNTQISMELGNATFVVEGVFGEVRCTPRTPRLRACCERRHA